MKQKLGLIVAAVVVLVLIAGAGVFTLLKFEARPGGGGVSVGSGAKEGVPADNSSLPVVYFNDFIGDPGLGWTANVTSDTPTSRPFLGPFANEKISLRLHDLPSHDLLRVSLELFIMDTWDGSGKSGWKEGSRDGPDFVEIDVEGGPSLLRATFSALPQDSSGFLAASKVQTYPSPIPSVPNKGGTGASAVNGLGYIFTFKSHNVSFPMDGTYPMTFTFPHTGEDLKLHFRGAGLNSLQDESWGITNVKVEVLSAKDVPSPTDAEIAGDWDKVIGSEPIAANQAFWRLVAAGDKTVAFLERNAGGFGVDKAAFDAAFEALKARPSDESLLQPLAAMGPKITPLLNAAMNGDRQLTNTALKVLREIEVTPIESPRNRRVAAAARLLSVIDTPAAEAAQRKLAAEPIPTPQQGTVAYDAEWRERFDAVYQLSPGENLKYIPRPFIPERKQYVIEAQKEFDRRYKVVRHVPQKDGWEDQQVMLLRMTADRITSQAQPSLIRADQPIGDSGGMRKGLLKLVALLGAQGDRSGNRPMVEAPPAFDDIVLDGDWLIRRSRTPDSQEVILKNLAAVVNQQTGRRIRFEKRQTQEECVVVTGTYAYKKPADVKRAGIVLVTPDRKFEAVSEEDANESEMSTLLAHLTMGTGVRFINETNRDNRQFKWAYSGETNRRDPKTGRVDDKWLDQVTSFLAEQTSLTFKRETRSFSGYIAVEDAAAATQPVER